MRVGGWGLEVVDLLLISLPFPPLDLVIRCQVGTRTVNVEFAEDLPEVPGIDGSTAVTTEDSDSLIIDLSGATDPEGSATLPVVTSLPAHGKLYQVGVDGTTKGDEIEGFFR